LASFTKSPVKQNHSPDSARRPTAKYVGPKLIVSYLYSPDGNNICSGNAILAGCHRFSLPPLI